MDSIEAIRGKVAYGKSRLEEFHVCSPLDLAKRYVSNQVQFKMDLWAEDHIAFSQGKYKTEEALNSFSAILYYSDFVDDDDGEGLGFSRSDLLQALGEIRVELAEAGLDSYAMFGDTEWGIKNKVNFDWVEVTFFIEPMKD